MTGLLQHTLPLGMVTMTTLLLLDMLPLLTPTDATHELNELLVEDAPHYPHRDVLEGDEPVHVPLPLRIVPGTGSKESENTTIGVLPCVGVN